MKLIKTLILFFSLVLGASCTLDLQENPNAIRPDQAIPNLLLNSMQTSLAGLYSGASGTGATLTRLQNSGGSTYFSAISPQGFDGVWTTAYAGILQDGKTLIASTDATGFARHSGIARVISGYVLIMMADMFGDVPNKQAFQGASNLSPAPDPGLSVYLDAIALLDKGILDLNTLATNATPTPGYLSPVATTPQDLYYNNDYTKWTRFANTVKLKAYLNMRVLDPATATTGINTAISTVAPAVGVITGQGDSFTFHYGINTSDPDARHPLFINNYPSGGGNYMSNHLIWQMVYGYGATQNGAAGDPRLRFYFYRQTTSNNTDPNNIRCATALQAPAHYPQVAAGTIVLNGLAGQPAGISTNPLDPAWTTNGSGSAGNLPKTFCYPTGIGYWGRDHLDPQGIPPDNFLRTAWGVYPAGGRYDNNNGAGVTSAQGLKGAGIQPIMMRAGVQFMLAEAVLYLPGVVTGSTADTHFQNGINNSIDDVRDFAINGTIPGTASPASATEAATINAAYPLATYTTDRNNYRGFAYAAFLAAPATTDSKMNIVAREHWISLFGNGVEAINLYRRTGMPSGMQPALTAAPTSFPRIYYYPAVFANLNPKVTQRKSTDLGNKVFWDMSTVNLDF